MGLRVDSLAAMDGQATASVLVSEVIDSYCSNRPVDSLGYGDLWLKYC